MNKKYEGINTYQIAEENANYLLQNLPKELLADLEMWVSENPTDELYFTLAVASHKAKVGSRYYAGLRFEPNTTKEQLLTQATKYLSLAGQ